MYVVMDTLPIEIVALIVTADGDTFLAALRAPGIGQLCCSEYIQNYAKRRFSSIEYKDGWTTYKLFGRMHRDNAPAATDLSGAEFWYRYGKRHRDDGPAVIYQRDSVKEWYRNDILHREDGPAIIYMDGYAEWYQGGKLHRDDGPAIESPDGTNYWYWNGHACCNDYFRCANHGNIILRTYEYARTACALY